MGDEWQSGGKTRHIVTWKKKEEKKKHQLHPLHPEPCIPTALFFPLLHLGGSNLHRLDLVHLCPHHLDTIQDLLLMAC